MQKFLLYVLLPGIILGGVYQSGRNAGELSAIERLVQKPEPVVEPVAKKEAPVVQPKPAAKVSAPVRKPVSEMTLEPVPAKPVPVAKPKVAPVRFPEDQIPRMIETDSDVVPMVHYAPASLSPAPTQSIYDRRPAEAVKASELGVVPLSPLQPLSSAVVYPGAQSARTTFKEPVPVRSVSPIRITSSSECDCGKEPAAQPVPQSVLRIPVTASPCSCGCNGGCAGGK